MGSRINYVLVEPGGYLLFYSHWGGQSVDRDAFWGPAATLRFVAAQRPSEGWLDDIWAEGGLLVDPARRVLRLWGGEEIHRDIPLRRIYMDLLARTWIGWHVGWAHEGIVGLARDAGFAGADGLAESKPCDDGIGGPATPKLPRSVLTIARSGEPVKAYALGGVVAALLVIGPEALDNVPRPRVPAHERLAVDFTPDSWLEGGAHADVDRRTLDVWSSEIPAGDLLRAPVRWPGWTVRLRDDRYEDHVADAGGALAVNVPSVEERLETLREILLRPLHRPSPAVANAAPLAAACEHVSINPLALQDHEGPELGDDDRRELLERLIAEYRAGR